MPEYHNAGSRTACSDCGALVLSQMQHDKHHADLQILKDDVQEMQTLRRELASADARANALDARRDAAVRVADAARALNLSQGSWREVEAALELWERVR